MTSWGSTCELSRAATLRAAELPESTKSSFLRCSPAAASAANAAAATSESKGIACACDVSDVASWRQQSPGPLASAAARSLCRLQSSSTGILLAKKESGSQREDSSGGPRREKFIHSNGLISIHRSVHRTLAPRVSQSIAKSRHNLTRTVGQVPKVCHETTSHTHVCPQTIEF